MSSSNKHFLISPSQFHLIHLFFSVFLRRKQQTGHNCRSCGQQSSWPGYKSDLQSFHRFIGRGPTSIFAMQSTNARRIRFCAFGGERTKCFIHLRSIRLHRSGAANWTLSGVPWPAARRISIIQWQMLHFLQSSAAELPRGPAILSCSRRHTDQWKQSGATGFH